MNTQTVADLVAEIMTYIEDIMTEAEVDYPAGSEAGPNILYDSDAIATRIRSVLSPAATEPVAWQFELARTYDKETGIYSNWGGQQLTFVKPRVPEGSIRNLTALYAASPSTVTVEAAAKVLLSWWNKETGGVSDARKVVSVINGLSSSYDGFERFDAALRALAGEKCDGS